MSAALSHRLLLCSPPWRILRVPRVPRSHFTPEARLARVRVEAGPARNASGQGVRLASLSTSNILSEPGLTCSGGQAGCARPAVFPFPGPRFSGLRFFSPIRPVVRALQQVCVKHHFGSPHPDEEETREFTRGQDACPWQQSVVPRRPREREGGRQRQERAHQSRASSLEPIH